MVLVEQPLLWVDLEMTGLDLAKDRIIEFACLVSSASLEHVHPGPACIVHQPNHIMDSMDPWCTAHHRDSGLTAKVLESQTTIEDVQEKVIEFIEQFEYVGRLVLAGNSVHVDRQFMCLYMPKLIAKLHYRIIDVSTCKELAMRWNPQALNAMSQKKETHRALDDILESIEELKYYKLHLFKVQQGL